MRHLKSSGEERAQHQARVAETKGSLLAAGIPVMENRSHIVPVFVGDAELCKAASDRLLDKHRIYIQPINYPTVLRGTERLRITPTPLHTNEQVDHLVEALTAVFQAHGLETGQAA